MGLDHYIYRVHRTSYDDSKVYEYEDLRSFGESGMYSLTIPVEDAEENIAMFEQIIPYCQRLKSSMREYNMGKIAADCGLPKDFHVWHVSSGYVEVGGKDPASGEFISKKISQPDVENKYTIIRPCDYYHCLIEEVTYWRKAYDVQEWFYENLDVKVENCGYYKISNEIVSRYNRRFGKRYGRVTEKSTEDNPLFYHEWY